MFKIIFDKYLPEFESQIDFDLARSMPKGETPLFTNDSFSFYTSVASVYSSKIEGEPIEADSYMKHQYMGVKFQPNYTKKTDDLFKAYSFARKSRLNTKNLFKAHKLLTKNILHKSQQGVIRQGDIQVLDEKEQINYVGTNKFNVSSEFEKLFADIEFLLAEQLTTIEKFYYAAVIHLLLLKIHPFNDGNARTARLIEKWFLSEKLGENAWFIPSEKYYYQNLNDYYRNLQRLGFEYETLEYERCLPFLLMLPSSLNQ
jgi:Fic family protein